MFPVSDVIPSRARPAVTLALITSIALAFAYEVRLDDGDLDAIVRRYGVTSSAFNWHGVLPGMFLHAGWLHAAVNVLSLWLFGPAVEDRLGRGRYLLLYLVCGFAAAVGHARLSATAAPLFGASGAIAGVMGTYLVLYPHSRVLTAVLAIVFFDVVEVPAVFYMGMWFVAQLFLDVASVGPATADARATLLANACALLAGAVCGVYLRVRAQTLRAYWSVEGQPRG
jgi:membrane associated rhomboid family serine protease